MINCLPDIIEMRLSIKGYRKTNSRKKILNYIVEKKDDFFTFNDFIKQNPGTNVSSFYNNINLFIENNIITKSMYGSEPYYKFKHESYLVIMCINCKSKSIKKVNNFNSIFKISNIENVECIIDVSKCDNCK